MKGEEKIQDRDWGTSTLRALEGAEGPNRVQEGVASDGEPPERGSLKARKALESRKKRGGCCCDCVR